MPQDQQAASPSIIPGVHHPQFEDDNPNFWRDAVSSYDNPNYVRGMNVDNPKYENSEPPAFIKQGLDMNKVTQPVKKPENEDESNSIAVTYSDKPYEVNVFHPEDYGNSVRNHELTHTFQFTRAIAPKEVGKLGATVNTPEAYKYGWVQGLEEAQKNHKTVSDFNLEQQADMVSDYKNIHDMYLDKAKKGKITPEDERLMYRAQKAYHPFVSQLAKMPAKKDQVTTNPLLQLLGYAKAPTINTKPEPPGLPSYDTPGLGVLPADPLMGGKSQETPTPPARPGTGKPGDPLNPYSQAPYASPEEEPPAQSYQRNKGWAKPPGPNGYVTPLSPDQEKRFQDWAHKPENWDYVQHDMGPAPGYDIRGWFKAMEAGDPRAKKDTNTHHFTDTWKTPYSGVFSKESMYALPTAPHWKGNDKEGWTLVTPDGREVTALWKPPEQKSSKTFTPNTNPNILLQGVLKKYPGLSKNFNESNTSVVFASGDRAKRGRKERGYLEFWDRGDKGPSDFPSPDSNKNVLEIYDDGLKNNPKELEQAVYGDLMHGMANDPYWKGLRTEFMQNFTPQELKRQEKKQAWSDDVNGTPLSDRFGPTYDAYIRGWLEEKEFGTSSGQKELGNTEYSPKQIQIMKQMQDYIKTGKPPEKPQNLSNSLGKKKPEIK